MLAINDCVIMRLQCGNIEIYLIIIIKYNNNLTFILSLLKPDKLKRCHEINITIYQLHYWMAGPGWINSQQLPYHYGSVHPGSKFRITSEGSWINCGWFQNHLRVVPESLRSGFRITREWFQNRITCES